MLGMPEGVDSSSPASGLARLRRYRPVGRVVGSVLLPLGWHVACGSPGVDPDTFHLQV